MANMVTNEAHDATEETQQIIQPDPMESLAENTSTIVSRLYSLHAALEARGDVYVHHIHLLSVTKKELGKQWEEWLEFFRECLGHLRTCRRLYEVLQSGEVTPVQAIAPSTLSVASKINEAASHLPPSYQAMLTFLLTEAKKAPQYPRYDDPQKPIDDQYLLPDVIYEFTSFLDALQSSVECLQGIAFHWSEHLTTLRAISQTELDIKDLIVEEGETVAMWTSYHDLVRQAVSDITSSCDALTVDPPQRKKSRKSLRSRLFLMATPAMPSPTLPLLLPPSTTSSLQERFRQENSLFLSNNQFDVPSVARVARRLQKLHLKDEQIPAKFVLAFELLIEIAEAGKVFYLNAGKLLQIPRSQDEMRGAVTRIRTTLDKDLALWHELNSLNLYDDSKLDDRGTELNGQVLEHDSYVQEALGLLVDKLTEFRKFWEKMALELEEDNIQNLLRIDELKLPREVWNLQVSHYRECIKEIKEAQTPFLSTDTSDGVRSRTIQHRRRIKQLMTSLLTLFQMRLACTVGFRGSQKMTREELVDFDDKEKDI